MNFTMTNSQMNAAKQAMDGQSPTTVVHLILFFATGFMVIWAVIMLHGLFQKMLRHQASATEVLFDMCMVIFILLIGCTYAFYN